MLQQRLGSGDAGVLCDKVRKVAVAAFAAPAECVNEGIPFQTIFIRKSSCAVSKIDIFSNFVVEKDITWMHFYESLLHTIEIELILWVLNSLWYLLGSAHAPMCFAHHISTPEH